MTRKTAGKPRARSQGRRDARDAPSRQGSSDALRFLQDRYIGDDPERVASYEAALANAEVARDVYHLRTEAGLTQAQLARLVGTTASAICRLEDAEYGGHSLSMLRRVAAAVGKRVEVRFVDVRP